MMGTFQTNIKARKESFIYVLIYLIYSYIVLYSIVFLVFFAVAATSARDSSDTILCDLL